MWKQGLFEFQFSFIKLERNERQKEIQTENQNNRFNIVHFFPLQHLHYIAINWCNVLFNFLKLNYLVLTLRKNNNICAVAVIFFFFFILFFLLFEFHKKIGLVLRKGTQFLHLRWFRPKNCLFEISQLLLLTTRSPCFFSCSFLELRKGYICL